MAATITTTQLIELYGLIIATFVAIIINPYNSTWLLLLVVVVAAQQLIKQQPQLLEAKIIFINNINFASCSDVNDFNQKLIVKLIFFC